jgi:hypothetical protein
MSFAFSLTPGFSPVSPAGQARNRFNGFPRAGKPLKRLGHRDAFTTRLKPGVNENICTVSQFYESHEIFVICHFSSPFSLPARTAAARSQICW